MVSGEKTRDGGGGGGGGGGGFKGLRGRLRGDVIILLGGVLGGGGGLGMIMSMDMDLDMGMWMGDLRRLGDQGESIFRASGGCGGGDY